ncbi:energy-coupling factor transport system permease protein [Gracilibacillus halotolerans]|uniref:Energy-coupling factor transport system permease protein n=1 Tax=Gracilibacillus halotolerans TaxID=74386 RepID=A0A841RNA7_9BACI|nr:energy-coupling factor transporter transmembrane component T [Gracilibacillus halotolerans]MBB6512434.1 energy-coupling factor transport system permease protein [Gracilibacillus halotolerans]
MDLQIKMTWLHHVNPMVKLFFLVFLFIGLLLIHHIHFQFYFLLFIICIYLFMTGCRTKWLLLLSLPLSILFFSSFLSMALFGMGETTWWKLGIVHITEESFFRGLHLGIRTVSFGLLGLVFALTTTPVQLFYSSMQQLRLKPKFAYSFMASIRILPIIVEEIIILKKALKVRGYVYSKGLTGFFERMNHYSVPILAQSIRRAHRIAIAMQIKQFNGDTRRTYYYKIGYSRHDIFFTLVVTVFFLVSVVLANILPVFPVDYVR